MWMIELENCWGSQITLGADRPGPPIDFGQEAVNMTGIKVIPKFIRPPSIIYA